MTKDKPRLLILGSRGFLGGYVVSAAEPGFHVLEGNRTAAPGPQAVAVDIADRNSVITAFRATRPNFVMLLAAMADIDRCQLFPEEAKAVNLAGPEHVAEACAQTGARLLFTSSAAVFDGTRHGYEEDSVVSPISVYGETKALAEQLVLALLPSAVVARFALVLGFAHRTATNAFLDTLKSRWASGETVALPAFEQRNPIDAETAARFLLDLLAKREVHGIFHLGCDRPISRYELGLKLASRMGYPNQVACQVNPTPGRAPRGPDHYLLTDKLRSTCGVTIPSCEQVIERCFDGLA